jgi:alpha-tubulin suppressor-like RCC1 family protein
MHKPFDFYKSASIIGLSNGTDHSAIVDQNGNILTYGSNKFHQLGRRSGLEDLATLDGDKIPLAISVSCGGWHTVSIHADGSVRSFGWGGSRFSGAGALGLGSKSSAPISSRIDAFDYLLGEDERIVNVACGSQHSLFLSSSGTLFATGNGAYGILGTGDANDELLPVELTALKETLLSDERVVKVSCGANFSALLTSQGNIYVWGRNDAGQLGLGEESQGDMHSAERYPRRIPFFETERIGIRDIVCGENHIVALAKNGAIYYWGDRTWLEPHVVALPEANGGLKGIVKLAAGTKYTFALSESGLVYAWGSKSSECLIADEIPKTAIVPFVINPSIFGYQKVIDISAGWQRCSAVTDSTEFVVTSESDLLKVKDKFGETQNVTVVESSS